MSAGGSGWAAPNVYGPKSRSNVSLFGSPGLEVRYTAEQVNNTSTLLCCQAKGFNSEGKETWYDIGASNSGSVSGIVPWGNVLAYPEIRGKGVPTGTMYQWRH